MGKQRRLLSMLGLAPSVVRLLQLASLLHDEDVRGLTPTELQEASGLRVSECCEVLRLAETTAPTNSVTVLDMVEQSAEVSHILTLCSSLDELLGGGLLLGAVTELAGTPGIGKTQLCLQACVSVQLPAATGGVAGEAVVIDAEGSICAHRLHEMAEHAVAHYQHVVSSSTDGSESPPAGDGQPFTTENILKNVHYYRCLSQLSVVSCIKLLPELLRNRPNIRLIVLDSIAFHLRHDVEDNRVRTGLLCSITQDLIQLATSHKIAVVVTNQMTTRIVTSTNKSGGGAGGAAADKLSMAGQHGSLIPALGESWAHCATVRVVLRWQDGGRIATLLKCPYRPNGTIKLQITAAGIRDIADSQTTEAADASVPTSAPTSVSSMTTSKAASVSTSAGTLESSVLSCDLMPINTNKRKREHEL